MFHEVLESCKGEELEVHRPVLGVEIQVYPVFQILGSFNVAFSKFDV